MSTHSLEYSYGDVLINPETGLPFSDYPREGDEVPESFEQFDLTNYLTNLLRWILTDRAVTVMGNICIYRHSLDKYPLSPDVVVFPLAFTPENRPATIESWKLYERDRPAPLVAFEISSASTWQADIERKPNDYQTLGVKEYFAYDPGNPPHWKNGDGRRLRGWEYTRRGKREILANKQGWLWSKQLDSWLVPAGYFIQFYDSTKMRRVGQVEAEAAAREAAEEAFLAEKAAREAAEIALHSREEALQKEIAARQLAEQAQARAEKQLEELKALLKKQGIEPPSF